MPILALCFFSWLFRSLYVFCDLEVIPRDRFFTYFKVWSRVDLLRSRT